MIASEDARETGRDERRGGPLVRSVAARSLFALQRACRQKRCKRTYPSSGYLRRGVNTNAVDVAVAIRHDRCVADCFTMHGVLIRDVRALRSSDGRRSRTRCSLRAACATLDMAPLGPVPHPCVGPAALHARGPVARPSRPARSRRATTSSAARAPSARLTDVAPPRRRRFPPASRDDLSVRARRVARKFGARDELSVLAATFSSLPSLELRCHCGVTREAGRGLRASEPRPNRETAGRGESAPASPRGRPREPALRRTAQQVRSPALHPAR